MMKQMLYLCTFIVLMLQCIKRYVYKISCKTENHLIKQIMKVGNTSYVPYIRVNLRIGIIGKILRNIITYLQSYLMYIVVLQSFDTS